MSRYDGLVAVARTRYRTTRDMRGAHTHPAAGGRRRGEGRADTLGRGNLANLAKPILPPTASERALFSNFLGIHMADVTMTPVSPARDNWRGRSGASRSRPTLTACLSIDPGALANMLCATGSVKLSSGQSLTVTNAAQVPMNTVSTIMNLARCRAAHTTGRR